MAGEEQRSKLPSVPEDLPGWVEDDYLIVSTPPLDELYSGVQAVETDTPQDLVTGPGPLHSIFDGTVILGEVSAQTMPEHEEIDDEGRLLDYGPGV